MTTFNISHHFYNGNSTRAGNVLVLIIAVSSFIYLWNICYMPGTLYMACTCKNSLEKRNFGREEGIFPYTHSQSSIVFFNSQLFCFVLAALGAHRPAQAFPSCGARGHSSSQGSGFSPRSLLLFGSTGSGLMGSGLRDMQAPGQGLRSCGAQSSVLRGCRTFPDRGLNLCPLHQQAGSYPLHHQRRPELCYFNEQ